MNKMLFYTQILYQQLKRQTMTQRNIRMVTHALIQNRKYDNSKTMLDIVYDGQLTLNLVS